MSSADAGVLQRQKAKVKRQTSVPVFLFTFYLTAERSHSGLVHRSRKPEWLYGHRGFESHPLRHCVRTTCGSGWLIVKKAWPLEINRPLPQGGSDSWRGARVVELAALEML